MKLVIAALVLAASPAFASSSLDTEPQMWYFSWCDGNKVMGQDDQANPIVRYTCNEQQTCQTISRYKIDRIIVTGSCVDNQKN